MRANPRQRDTHIFVRDPEDFYLEPSWCSERLFDVEPFDHNSCSS
jgi:hypothetical protein